MTRDPIEASVIAALKEAAGPSGWLDAADDMAPYLEDERGLYHGETPLVLRPRTVEEVAGIVRLCADHGIGVVPQGGNTGYCGGAVPSGRQILVNVSRLNTVRAVDPANGTMTVEAGCILQSVQQAAEEHGLLFPLSLAAEGTCQIGGNLATNAGGIQVLKYGNARDLVLGLEVVTASGEIWDGLRGLRKDNTGYDLKNLFIGAEGTLGIITAAVLKLYPRPRSTVTALVAATDPHGLPGLLAGLQTATGGGVTSFEYIERTCLDLVFAQVEGTSDPFASAYPHYALIELASGQAGGVLRETAEIALGDAFENEVIVDAVLADSGEQAARLWELRETIPEAQKRHGGCIKHDVSVPVSKVPEMLAAATARAEQMIPGVRVAPFGHLGDGNIHFNLSQGDGVAREDFLAKTPDVSAAIHEIVVGLGGSFSAEHGVGLLKQPEMIRHKTDTDLALMRAVKRALDPQGIMNPGKVIPTA